MYATRSSKFNRLLEKTPEQLFINSLRKEFELSPAESKGILDLAKQCLFGQVPQLVGKIKCICASKRAKHGKALSEQEMLEVELTLDGGIEDLNVLKDQGPKALRQLKIMRLTEEAWDQDGSLTQEDLARILQVTSRTIRQDINELVRDGNFIHTRGTDHDIGRSLTHKSQIIEMYLEGQTYDTIMRYIVGFGRLLLLQARGIEDVKQLSRLLGQSERLTLEYLEIYQRHIEGDKWPAVYIELLDQLKALYPAKKKSVKGVCHED